MDGTILSSIAAAERVWGRWAEKHGLDVAAFVPTIHGQRGVDTISKQNLPGIDIKEEADWITREELIDLDASMPSPVWLLFLRLCRRNNGPWSLPPRASWRSNASQRRVYRCRR